MKLKIIEMELESTEPLVVINQIDCLKIGVREMDRVILEGPNPRVVLVNSSNSILQPGKIMMSRSLMTNVGVREGEEINVNFSVRPTSVECIRKTLDRIELNKDEINLIIQDILESRLSKVEISSWLSAVYINGLTPDEVYHLTVAMASTGCSIEFDNHPIFDFHSVGGVPGNKITPIIVSIVAAAGLSIPKTSSRAISSACGTSDFVEVFCNVAMKGVELKRITDETGGVFAWGGAMNMTPVNGMIIEVQYPLGIDPRSMMLASIMSKKLAMKADYLLMDLPMGRYTKVRTMDEAHEYARDFIDLGQRLGIHVECAITCGDQPIGYAIGPALEARECIQVLEGNRNIDGVKEKSCELAGIILEMGGIKDGRSKAEKILESGEALTKFRQIVFAQGGRADLASEHIVLGKFVHRILSPQSGYILDIKNKDLVSIARIAGAPRDKGAGILLHRKNNDRVERNEILFEIFAENQSKADRSRDMALKLLPIEVGGMVMRKMSDKFNI